MRAFEFITGHMIYHLAYTYNFTDDNHLECLYLLDKHTTQFNYHEVTSSNRCRLEAHAGFFRLLIKGIFDFCVL